jgi:hypothetical protein
MTDYGAPLQFGLSLTLESADMEAVTGLSRLADNIDVLDGPTIWTARVGDNKITQWRVYHDTSETPPGPWPHLTITAAAVR